MPGESLPNPEDTVSTKFVNYVETHAQIILDTSDENLPDRDITRRSDWQLTDKSQLIPIDTVRFQVIIDLKDPSLFHEMIFSYKGENVFFLGYDAQSRVFTAAIGEGREDAEFSDSQIRNLLDELAFRELSGSLVNNENHDK